MCGRFVFDAGREDIKTRFRAAPEFAALEPHYNITPGMFVPIVLSEEKKRVARLARWGLVPGWATDPNVGYKMINARAEGIEEKPSFRSSFRTKRCLIPTTGFFEWKHIGREKIPYYLHLTGEAVFSFAGLYSTWSDAEDRALLTCTIITTTPNTLVSDIHDRMPVIFEEKDESVWLNPEITDPNVLLPLLDAYPADRMAARTVSRLVNTTTNDSPDVLAESQPNPSIFG